MTKRVGRFAPAPTGRLHVGHLWVWLLNHDYCDLVYLRVDDTNRPLTDTMLLLVDAFRTSKIFGLRVDGVFLQSRRGDTHVAALGRLDTTVTGGATSVVWRAGEEVSFYEHVRGRKLTKRPEKDLEVVLLRSDGRPTYLLANWADDEALGVNTIFRASDHIDSTFVQCFLTTGSKSLTNYFLCPLLYGEGGHKLSKSAGASSLEDLLREGLRPAQITGFLRGHVNSAGVPSPRPFELDRLLIANQPVADTQATYLRDYRRFCLLDQRSTVGHSAELVWATRQRSPRLGLPAIHLAVTKALYCLERIEHHITECSPWGEVKRYLLGNPSMTGLLDHITPEESRQFRIGIMLVTDIPGTKELFVLWLKCRQNLRSGSQ